MSKKRTLVVQKIRRSVRASSKSPETLRTVGERLLNELQHDFLLKSRGGQDRNGESWEPLAQSTIAKREAGQVDGEEQRRKIASARNEVYRHILASLRSAHFGGFHTSKHTDSQDRDLQRQARIQADQWLAAETKRVSKKNLNDNDVEILRQTLELFNSYSPSGHEHQVFKITDSQLEIGSTEKPWHEEGSNHLGVALPPRPILPDDGALTELYWEAVQETVVASIKSALAEVNR
jgi:hypothetical protein